MPIVEGPPSFVSTKAYVAHAFPHQEGTLWATDGATVRYSFEWHEYFEEPAGIPWPFLECRKTFFDNEGNSHSCSSFTNGCVVFDRLGGDRVYSEKVFLSKNKDVDVRPLTSLTQVYCDSREMLMFEFFRESLIEEPMFVAHFEKHSGGHIRLLNVDDLIYMEVRMPFFDDYVSGGNHIELHEPVFCYLDLDLWRNLHHAKTPDEFRARYSSPLLDEALDVPSVFSRDGAAGDPDENVRLLTEPWTPTRAQQLVNDEIRRLQDRRREHS